MAYTKHVVPDLPPGYTLVDTCPPVKAYVHLRRTAGLSPINEGQAACSVKGTWFGCHITYTDPAAAAAAATTTTNGHANKVDDDDSNGHVADNHNNSTNSTNNGHAHHANGVNTPSPSPSPSPQTSSSSSSSSPPRSDSTNPHTPAPSAPVPEVVAMGRIIGDGGWYYHIADMASLPQHQRRGLGAAVLRRLLREIEDRAPEGRAYISLMGDPPGRSLYAKNGFEDAMPWSLGMYQLFWLPGVGDRVDAAGAGEGKMVEVGQRMGDEGKGVEVVRVLDVGGGGGGGVGCAKRMKLMNGDVSQQQQPHQEVAVTVGNGE